MPTLIDRRKFLSIASCAFVLSHCGGLDIGLTAKDSFDTFLDRIHETDVEFGGGLSNHAPMAAECLVTLGHSEQVVPFAKGYAAQLAKLMKDNPLSEKEKESALGDFEKRAALIATYQEELKTTSPQELLKREWPKLCSGFIAAGWHGFLRTAHALRSLQRKDTESRRRELAHGLGYWSSRYVRLPGKPGARKEKGLNAIQALSRVRPISKEKQVRGGSFAGRFAPLENNKPFVDLLESVDIRAIPAPDAIGSLASLAARMYVNEGNNNVFFLHAITSMSAFRMMLPWLDEESQYLGLGYAFQTLAGALVVQGTSSEMLKPVNAPGTDAKALRQTISTSTDPHSIKLVEAAVREYSFTKAPELLKAAEDWLLSR